MGFVLEAKDLVSREIREIVAPEGRVIKDLLNVFERDSSTSLGDQIVGFGKKLIGFAASLPGIVLSFTSAFGWLVGKASAIANFNWQATDAQLQQGLRDRNLAVASAWGGFVGQLGGTIAIGAVGVGLAFAIPVIGGPGLALGTIAALVQQRGDEVWDSLKDALRVTFDAALRIGAVNLYILFRKAVRAGANAASFLPEGIRETLSTWGTKEGARWTISGEIEERIDSIDNQYVQAFVEEALEEGWESFIEGGYVIARHWDEQMNAAKQQTLEVLGEDRSLTLELDKDNDGEVVKLTKIPSNLARAQVNGLINTYRLIRNRDIGSFEEPDDSEKVLQPYLRTCKIFMRGGTKSPPFIDPETGKPSPRHQLTLKALKPDLAWKDFKRALRNMRFGPYLVEATLESRVTIKMFAADSELGKAKLRQIIEDLCEEDVIRLTVKEEDVDPSVAKVPIDSFPQRVKITLKRKVAGGSRLDLAGQKYEVRREEYNLWPEEKPYTVPDFLTNFPITGDSDVENAFFTQG